MKCGQKLAVEEEEALNDTVQSSADSLESGEEQKGAFATVFDKVDESEVTRLELLVEQGLPEWRDKATEPKKYRMGCLEKEKVAVADLSEVPNKEVTKTLLDDLFKISIDLQAEELYVTVSLLDPARDKLIRNLLVYGFEKSEAERFTSNPDLALLKIEVNQEDDFVDLI